ncbi:hypothetical protein [Motilibacter rhizosphaerae]|uniref:hypothetical protein n=1 Tax=Motilibacter rhizosphaerae TaxID=598652 RepID=UPI00102BF5EE|nr:hypothetical protein [Motilibacter rhizosphaerae]
MAVHACRVLDRHERVLFVTVAELDEARASIGRARDDGYRLVIVPPGVARMLGRPTTGDQPVTTLSRFEARYNDSFAYDFVAAADLTEQEQAVLALARSLLRLAGTRLGGRVKAVRVLRTMRLGPAGTTSAGSG